jgi:hypothetical protein
LKFEINLMVKKNKNKTFLKYQSKLLSFNKYYLISY